MLPRILFFVVVCLKCRRRERNRKLSVPNIHPLTVLWGVPLVKDLDSIQSILSDSSDDMDYVIKSNSNSIDIFLTCMNSKLILANPTFCLII